MRIDVSGVRVAAAAAIALAGCGSAVDRVVGRDGDPDAGATVFADVCAACHAADGSGGEGPSLLGNDDAEEELADKILWGWGAMDGFRDALSLGEVADVIAFVQRDLQPASD